MVTFDGLVVDRLISTSGFGRRRTTVLTLRMPDDSMVKICEAPYFAIGSPIQVECSVEDLNGYQTFHVKKVLSGLEEVVPSPKPTELEW